MTNSLEIFDTYCKERYGGFCDDSGGGCPKSKTITSSKAKMIVRVLKKDTASVSYCPKFKHWVKQRGFQLVTHSALGLMDILCLPAKQKPILSSGFMTRGQIDLIDMRHRPDGTYKWVGHYMDHWSKFHVLFPLMRKSGAEVGLNLQNQVFAYLGTPRILHSYNGREFVNEIVQEVVRSWSGMVTIVNGRPRNPKCQGLVEQGNYSVEKLLAARFHEHECDDYPPWSEWLPFVQYQLNATVHGTMRKSPYELAFGQPPCQNIFPGVAETRIMEEDVEDVLEEKDEVLDNSAPICVEDRTSSPPRVETSLRTQGRTSPPLRVETSLHTQDRTSPPPRVEDRTVLGTSLKHLKLRKEADERYRKNAENMQMKYCKAKRKKVTTFHRGDFVSTKVKKIDRTSTDCHRLPCVVIEVLGKEFHLYRLRCEFGVLDKCNGEGDLELSAGKFNLQVDGWEVLPRLSLHEASKLLNNPNEFQCGVCSCA